MASEREDCIDGIARKTGRGRKEVESDLEELLDRADRERAGGKSAREALSDAGEEMLNQMGEHAAVYKRAEQLDALNRAARHRWYKERLKEGHSAALVMEAKMVGVNTPFDRSRNSAEATHGVLTEKYAGGFALDLERAQLDRLFASRSIEKEWTEELAQLNDPRRGKPGITGNKQAMEIAALIHKWRKVSVGEINDAGGWVKSYSGYITRTEHGPDLIRTGGRSAQGQRLSADDARAKWIASVLKNVDMKRTFGSADIGKILPKMWSALARGDHFEIKPLEDEPVYTNIARQASASRELHFKSAEAWRAYVAEFGPRNPTAAVVHAFDVAARRVALLQHFGTKPRLEFENDLAMMKKELESDPAGYDQFTRQEPYLRNLYNQLDHSANKPANELWSRTVAGVMAMQRWSKLSRVMFTHLASLPTKAVAGRYVGLSFAERYRTMLSGLFLGGPGTDKRAAADLALAGVHARLGHMMVRYDVADQAPGVAARIDQTFFKLTGVTAAVDNQRADFETIVANHYGNQRGTGIKDLGQAERRALSLYGIGDAEWKALHTVDWSNIGGRQYLMPVDASKISDDAIRTMLNARGTTSQRAVGATAEMVRKAREDLRDSIHAMLYDQGRYAIFEPSARTRAVMFQGTATTSPNLYKAMQLLWQFKIWPAEMITRTWGRMIYGGDGNLEKLGSVLELTVASAVFGVLAEMLREVVQGQDPRARIAAQPASYLLRGLLRSGAGTIAGDYLFGEFDRHGHSILGSIAGPTYGQAENIINLRNEFLEGLTKGKWAPLAAGAAHEVRQNLPFVDMWWTFKAFDYMVTYRFLDWLNPGYLRRFEQKQQKERGIQYLLRPSAVVNG